MSITIDTTNAVGFNLWWQFSKTLSSYSVLRELAEELGLEEHLPAPTYKKAFTQAFKHFETRKNKILARRVAEDKRSLTHSLVFESVENNEELKYAQETTATLDKQTGDITIKGVLSDDIRSVYNTYRNSVTDNDLRVFMRKALESIGAIPKKPSGGIYFVPKTKAEAIEKIAKVVETSNTKNTVYIERVFNGEMEKETVIKTFKEVFFDRINDVLEKVDNIDSSTKCARNQSASLEELAKLTEYYKEININDTEISEVLIGIETAKQVINEKIEEINIRKAKKALNK